MAQRNFTVSSITESAGIATLTTSSDHALAANAKITVTGATPVGYNVTDADILSVPAANQITYEVPTSLAPATGTISMTSVSVAIQAESQSFQDSKNNVDVNVETGETLNLQSPIVGIDSTFGVTFGGISGGTDQETDAQLRVRLLNRIQVPVSHFSVADITNEAQKVAGVTRVFVEEVTPAVGQVTVYFMRDNDLDPIPSAGEVTAVKNQLLTIKPANTADADLIVAAPTDVTVNFNFSVLSPNTTSMQAAINANLQQFFAEETSVGVNIQQDAYRAAIQNTIDSETGDRVLDFNLTTPVGDIVIASGSIGTLGTVTYP